MAIEKEPLKNKEKTWFLSASQHLPYYKPSDIKSAVEWLKQECNDLSYYSSFDKELLFKTIDEAFEDVTKR